MTISLSNRGQYYIGNNVEIFDVAPVPGNVVKVMLWVDDANYVQSPAVDSGATGITVEADCPYATQALADAVLAMLQTHSYSPYSASNAEVDPSAELGDGITSNGVYSGIYSLSKDFSKRSAAQISAPINTETQHEFQYEDGDERRFIRQAKQVSKIGSELSLKMDKIFAQVTGAATSFGWELTDTAMSWKANGAEVMRLDSMGLQINGSLTAHAVIAGSLEVGGLNMTAYQLGTGASWPITDIGGGYTNGSYSITGGGYGFNYNSSSTRYSTVYASFFRTGMLQLSDNTVFSSSIRLVINGTPYRLIGFETT